MAPGVDLTVGINANAEGGTGGDIGHIALQLLGQLHHGQRGRHVDLRVIRIGEGYGQIDGSNEHEQEDDQEHDQTGHAQLVVQEIEKAGGIAKEFNTIAVDDGIAMGHTGMLYSLPSRDIIADSVEYMVNAHKADALV